VCVCVCVCVRVFSVYVCVRASVLVSFVFLCVRGPAIAISEPFLTCFRCETPFSVHEIKRRTFYASPQKKGLWHFIGKCHFGRFWLILANFGLFWAFLGQHSTIYSYVLSHDMSSLNYHSYGRSGGQQRHQMVFFRVLLVVANDLKGGHFPPKSDVFSSNCSVGLRTTRTSAPDTPNIRRGAQIR